jgi:hypothetical protein
MSEENPQVEDEIEDHKSDLSSWILAMEVLTIPVNSQGVVDRFVRDCKTLIDDLDSKDIVKCSDLVDFTDTRNSLEIRYINITNSLK